MLLSPMQEFCVEHIVNVDRQAHTKKKKYSQEAHKKKMDSQQAHKKNIFMNLFL